MLELEERHCPVCETATPLRVLHTSTIDESRLDGFAFSSRKFPEGMHHQMVLCERCGLLFANPAPKAQELVAQYEAAAYDSGVEADLAARTYAHYLKKHLDVIGPRKGALDIGSGNGSFLERLVALGFSDVVGVEPSLAPIQAAKPTTRSMLVHAPFRAADFQKASLALVSCFQTLEHVHDPGEMTRQVFDLLVPGGGVFFVAHNYEGFVNRLMGTRSPIYDIEHLQLFSPRSLEELLRRAGLTSVTIFPITNSYPLNYWLRLAPFPRSVKERVIRALDRGGLGQMNVRVRVGNLGAIGRKPS